MEKKKENEKSTKPIIGLLNDQQNLQNCIVYCICIVQERKPILSGSGKKESSSHHF